MPLEPAFRGSALVALAASAWLTSHPALAISIQHNRPDSGFVSPEDALFGGVGSLTGNGRICTAAAIAPTIILTAAHCVEGSNYTFRYLNDSTPGSIGLSSTLLHPSYQRSQGGDSFNANGDIALGFLSSPLPAGVLTYGIWSGSQIPFGAAIILNGFGQAANGAAGKTGAAGIHRYGYNYIEGSSYGGTAFESRFDYQPGPASCPKLGCQDVVPGGRTVGRFESIITPGDSGGPVLFSGELDFLSRAPAGLSVPPGKGSQPLIIGINSYSYQPGYVYGTAAGFTFVGSYTDWILQHAVLASSFAGSLGGPIESVTFNSTGDPFAFPLPPDPEAVPEPATAAFLLIGVAAILLRHRV